MNKKYTESTEENPEPRILTVQSHLNENNLDSAQRELQDILEMDNTLPKAINLYGITKMKSGRSEEAIGHFKKASELHPNFWEFHYNLGEIYLTQGNHKEAFLEYLAAFKRKKSLKILERLFLVFQTNYFLTAVLISLILIFTPFTVSYVPAIVTATICYVYLGFSSIIYFRIGNKKHGFYGSAYCVLVLALHLFSILNQQP